MTDDLATVATFTTLSEAEAAKLTLESEGICAMIDDTDWNTMGIPVPNVQLRVNEEDLERATELLAEHGHTLTSDEPDEDDAPETVTCLECGTEIPEGKTKCPKCGWSYVA
jgi:Putative prokaryotic signal transducing protein